VRGAPISYVPPSLESYSFLEEARDLTCANLIRRALNWSPSAATWWDYQYSTPSLCCEIRSRFDEVVIELGGPVAQSWEFMSRDDMKIDYAKLYIMRERLRTDGTSFRTIEVEGSAPALPGPGSLIASIVMGTDADGNEEPVPANIAATLVSEMNTLQWEGKVVCVESECTFLARPGNALNFSGSKARAAWANMDATVQQVDLDLVTGRTVVSFGPPAHLSPQDMIAILNSAKTNRPPTNPPNPGGGPGGGGPGGGVKPKAVSLEICDGTTLNVLTLPDTAT